MQTTDYKRSTGVSQSELKTLAESPRKYEAEYILKTLKREQTDAMRFGSLVHCLVLEPEDFEDHFVVIPPEALASNGHRRGKAWDEFKQQQIALNKKIYQKQKEARKEYDSVILGIKRRNLLIPPLIWLAIGLTVFVVRKSRTAAH